MTLHSLKASGLVKHYNDRLIVNNLSFNVTSGQVVGLLGPNGAGKTTLFKLLVGMIYPDGGSIVIDDEPITALPMHQRAWRGLRYLPQETSIFRGLTVSENLLAIAQLWQSSPQQQRAEVDKLLDSFGLSALRDSKATSLSGGERRRVEIARALIGSPHFLLLDEPFAGIDPKAIVDIRQLILKLAREGLGILVTDHNVHEMFTLSDQLIVMNEGCVVREGAPQDLRHDPYLQGVYLGGYLMPVPAEEE